MDPAPTTREPPGTSHAALRRGFLIVGPLVTAALFAAEYLVFSGYDGIHPGWWIVYPLVYLASSSVAGWLARRSEGSDTSGHAPSRGLVASMWLPLLGGVLAAFAMVVLLMPATRHGDYLPAPSRYVLTVVDAAGQPVPGVRVRLLEAGRDGVPPATSSDLGLGLYVLADDPLTDADGRLVIDQPRGAAISSRTTYTVLGIVVAAIGRRGSRTLSVQREGYRETLLSLDELDRAQARKPKRLEIGKDGKELLGSDVRVVLEPHDLDDADYGGR